MPNAPSSAAPQRLSGWDVDQWSSDRKEYVAWAAVTLSMLGFSWVPVFLVWGNAGESPTAFTFGIQTAVVVLIAVLFGKRLWREWITVRSVLCRAPDMWLLGTVTKATLVLFALALAYLKNPVVVAVLYETWPVVMIALIAFVRRFELLRRQDGDRPALWVGFALCLVGTGVFVAGQSSGQDPLRVFSLEDVTAEGLIGLLLMSAAVLSGALHVTCTRQLGEELNRHFTKRLPDQVFCILVAIGVTIVFALPVLLVSAWWFEESMSWWSVFMAGCCGAALTVGMLSIRLANSLAGYNVNVVYYLSPVCTLVWLLLLGETGEAPLRVDILLIGVLAIVAGNLMAVFGVDNRLAFRGMVLSIWLFGGWVYVYDGPPFKLYYESIVAVVTVFVLLLSFRRDRVSRRVEREQNDALWLWRGISSLVGNEPERILAVRTQLRKMVTARHHDQLEAAYDELLDQLPASDGGDPTGVRARIDALATSRHEDVTVGELVVICALGLAAIVGMLAFLPQGAQPGGAIGLFAELSGVLISASIVFLFLSIVDLQHQRRQPVLPGSRDTVANTTSQPCHRPQPSKEDRLVFPREGRRRLEVFIAVGASMVIFMVYGYLLWQDWLGVPATGAGPHP